MMHTETLITKSCQQRIIPFSGSHHVHLSYIPSLFLVPYLSETGPTMSWWLSSLRTVTRTSWSLMAERMPGNCCFFLFSLKFTDFQTILYKNLCWIQLEGRIPELGLSHSSLIFLLKLVMTSFPPIRQLSLITCTDTWSQLSTSFWTAANAVV